MRREKMARERNVKNQKRKNEKKNKGDITTLVLFLSLYVREEVGTRGNQS
jgi:hypothetical protein